MAVPPYGAILDSMARGEVVPFLGAGASLTTPPVDSWEKSPTSLPSGRQLARWLAERSAYPGGEGEYDLAKVASYYQAEVDRPGLCEALRTVFLRESRPRPLHELLADFPRPLFIVTTNFDDLIERAFRDKKRPFHLVVHPTDRDDLAASVLWWKPGDKDPKPYPPSQLPLSLSDTPIIYKMHGSIDRDGASYDSFVITEEDYVDFLGRMSGQSAIPARFLEHFQRSRFLFLGYGLGDWNFRVMLQGLKQASDFNSFPSEPLRLPNNGQRRTKLRSWAIQFRPSELETKLWGRREVNIYDLNLDEFVVKLRAEMNRIGAAPPALVE